MHICQPVPLNVDRESKVPLNAPGPAADAARQDTSLLATGWRILRHIQPKSPEHKTLWTLLRAYAHDGFMDQHDTAGWLTCVLALEAVQQGSYGVGALLLDEQGHLMAFAPNRMLDLPFRSDAHAEMIVISQFEDQWPDRQKRGMTLYSSLEPCPMCYARLLTSGIGTVYYVADDEAAGMVHLAEKMPPVWRALAANRRFERAPVDEGLRQLAMDIFMINGRELDERLKRFLPVKADS